MEWWQAAVLGLVEGITEYLPISSTGHLIIASGLMGLDQPEALKRHVDDFNIIIQGGAILAVLGLYWPRVVQMLKGLAGKDAAGLRLLVNLIVAFIPAAVFGLLLDDLIERYLFRTGPVLAALFLGGIGMMALDAWRSGRFGLRRGRELDVMDVTLGQALVIGLFQCVAMWPGTSRSMMTIGGGYIVGLKPRAAAEFSFLLGLPTLGAACVYKLAKNLVHARRDGAPNVFEALGWVNAGIGLVIATIAAVIAVRWLVSFLNRHGLTPFGWYRIALCVVLLVLSVAGVVRVGA